MMSPIGPQPVPIPAVPYPGYPQVYPAPAPRAVPLPGFRFLPADCEHCFCKVLDDTRIYSNRHEQCCNCGTQRLKKD